MCNLLPAPGASPQTHQGGCSSPLDPHLLFGSMLRIDMVWATKNTASNSWFQSPPSSLFLVPEGGCGTGFRTLFLGRTTVLKEGISPAATIHCLQPRYSPQINMPTRYVCVGSGRVAASIGSGNVRHCSRKHLEYQCAVSNPVGMYC